MRFIGVDLAWKMRPAPSERRTALVALSEAAAVLDYRRLSSDDEVMEACAELCSSGCILGVDAPLVAPPDTRGRRVCEASLMEMGVRVMPVDPARFERWYGGCRGVALMEKLRELDAGFELVDRLPTHVSKPVAEVYPTGSWRRLFGDVPRFKGTDAATKRKSLMKLIRRLEGGAARGYPRVDLGNLVEMVRAGAAGLRAPRAQALATSARRPPPELSKPSRVLRGALGEVTGHPALEAMSGAGLDALGDALDAVMSAYTVLLWHRDPSSCEVVGSLEKGFIVLPRSPGELAGR